MGHETSLDSSRGRYLENRIRIGRLLNGDGRPQDLSALLRNLRGRCFGIQSIKDLGDFTAHEDGRDGGMTVGLVNDLAQSSRLHMFVVNSRGHQVQILPAYAPDAIRASFRRMGSAFSAAQAGMNRKRAHRALEDILARLTRNNDGTFRLPRLSPEEARLLSFVAGTFTTHGAYEQDSLIRDFIHVLKRNHLVDDREAKVLKDFSTRLAVFALCAMHRVDVILSDGSLGTLKLARNWGKPNEPHGLVINAGWPVTLVKDGGEINVSFHTAVFITRLSAEEWCSDELQLEPGNFHEVPIEIRDDWKLYAME